jgi:PAS domain S-box-containing protein
MAQPPKLGAAQVAVEPVTAVTGVSDDASDRFPDSSTPEPDGWALHEMIVDQSGAAIDYRFLDVNQAFERIMGWCASDIIGKTVRQLLPNIEDAWIERYGRVVRTGEAAWFESPSGSLGKEFEVVAFRTQAGRFACIFRDITARKVREWEATHLGAKLREAQGQYRRLFEHMREGFALCQMLFDEKGNPADFIYLAVNPAFETLTGLRDVAGRKASEVIPGIREQDPDLMTAYGRVAATGNPEKVEVFVQSLQTWYSISLFSPENQFFIAVFEVITARKDAEAKLLDSELRLKQLIESLPQLVWTCAANGQCSYLSPQWEAYTGIPVALQYGFTWIEQIHSDDRGPVMDAWQVACFNVEEFVAEFRIRRYDGAYHWFMTRALPIKDDRSSVVLWLGTCTDIDEVRSAKERLHLLGSIVECSDDAIIGKTLEGVILSWNRGAERIYGYSAEEMLGTHVSILVPPDRDDDLAFGLGALRSGRNVEHYQTERIRKDGSRIWVSLSLSLIYDTAGNISGACSIGRDITELKLAEERARDSEQTVQRLNSELEARVTKRTAQLEAANQELEAFSYSVSHDLRAPLRALDGFSANLLSRYSEAVDDRGRHYLNRIQQAALRMGQLIDALLSLSRVTRKSLEWSHVDLSEMSYEIAAGLQAQDPERQAAIRIAGNLRAEGDPRLIRIVLQNLLGNAWKFTSRKSEALIEVGAFEQDGASSYFVRDNGAGFDMSYSAQLFGPFQRLHSQNEFAGTGIGLATVNRIIKRHGGRIWAESAVDQGATFYFNLGGKP